jgi:RNA polymerase sigma-70 factor, ECF subfamily
MARELPFRRDPTSAPGSLAEAEDRWQTLLDQYGRLLRQAISRFRPQRLGVQTDDIEQEARLRLWKALRAERNITDPASYLYRVAATAAIDAVRRVKARREDPLPDPGEGTAEPASADPSADRLAGRRQLLGRVQESLQALPEPRRRAVALYLQGFGSGEIGRLLGWSEAKARNLLYRGLKDLRDALQARGIEYEGD